MRRRDLYRKIGYTRRRALCERKTRYSSRSDAAQVVSDHERMFLLCIGMNEYWCDLHGCWHIGHSDKHQAAALALRKDLLWFEHWSKRSWTEALSTDDRTIPIHRGLGKRAA